MDTTKAGSGAVLETKKGRVFTRPFGTFRTLEVSDLSYFGASGFGAAGFAAPAPLDGLGVTGFAAGVEEAGAATPDFTL